jgi:hypothetical protein
MHYWLMIAIVALALAGVVVALVLDGRAPARVETPPTLPATDDPDAGFTPFVV